MMSSQRTRDIQVGLMVVVAIGVLIGGIMFFKRVSLDTDMVAYHVDFPAVEGLRKGDRVQARGIRVGQVDGFEIMTGKVRVTVAVEEWLTLHDDANVVLVMKGLVGEMLVEVEPGSGEPVELSGRVRRHQARETGHRLGVQFDQAGAPAVSRALEAVGSLAAMLQ